jgi:hypothetical protein
VALFLALLSTAISLGPALAHLLELPNKMQLPADLYFATQQLYNGWAWIAVVLLVQLVSIIAVGVLGRSDPSTLYSSLVALAGLIAAQAVFWIWTYPANVATAQWTKMPENLEALRVQWEYSHAAGAVFQLTAMAALIVAAVAPLWRAYA